MLPAGVGAEEHTYVVGGCVRDESGELHQNHICFQWPTAQQACLWRTGGYVPFSEVIVPVPYQWCRVARVVLLLAPALALLLDLEVVSLVLQFLTWDQDY